MRVRIRVSFLGVCLLAAIAAVWLARHRTGLAVETGVEQDTAAGQAADSRARSTSELASLSTEARREPVDSSNRLEISGFVRSSRGLGLTEARVDLVRVAREDLDCQSAWHEGDWGSLERESWTTESDGEGGFSFSLSADDFEEGLVLLATHPVHQAGELFLPRERSEWALPVEIVLQPADAMEVVVLDPSGAPAPGATVEHYGLAPAERNDSAHRMTSERGRRYLHRTYTTTVDGCAELEPFPGTQALIATRGNERSSPWKGLRQDAVTLRLAPTFEIAGQVHLPSWNPRDYPAEYPNERRITIAVGQRNLWRELHTIRSVDEGSFGPVRVPLLEADHYRVRLEGAPIITTEVLFDPPLPGSRIERDLVATRGMDLWLRVSDEEDRFIPTASVTVEWQDPGDLDRWVAVKASSTAREQIGVRSIPRGLFKCTATAPGFAALTCGPLEAEEYENVHLDMRLQKAARLRGKVLHGGRPVTDFEIVVWQPNDGTRRHATPFFDREDGTFELEDVPTGEFWVTASSPATPACEPIVLTAMAGTTVEATLELLDGLSGRGRILDQETGEPLADASVQLFVKGDYVPIARWGPPLPARRDGSFEFVGFLPGLNYLRALAPGHSSLTITRECTVGSAIEFGDLVLSRTQDFTIRLDPPESAEGATVQATAGTIQLARTSFPADGVVVFPGLSAGAFRATIEEPGNTYTFSEMSWNPGEDWTLRVRLAGSNHLTVTAVSEGLDAMAKISWLEATYQSSQGFRTIKTKYPEGVSVVEFEGVDAPNVSVLAYDQGERVCAHLSGTFQDGHLRLELPFRESSLLLTIVDAASEPLSDVRVLLTDPRELGFTLFGNTDDHGQCRLDGVPSGEALVSLQHSSGSHYGIPVDAGAGSVELVLDPRATLELEFRDGQTALAGVFCAMLDHTGSRLTSGPLSDEAGRVTIRDLGADTYHLQATRTDCWPTTFQAEARIEEQLTTVQVRRLADLEIVVVTANGLPVAGLPVELRSSEFEVDVADWIATNQVRSAGLMTDLRGRVRIERIPRGAYRWRVSTEGEPDEGMLDVEPVEHAPFRIVLH